MRVSSSALILGLGVAAAFGTLSLGSRRARADDMACKPVQDALIANSRTPYHSFVTITFAYAATVAEAHRKMKLPDEQKSETIFTGSAVFVRLLPGKWKSLPGTLAQFQDGIKGSVAGLIACRHLADDTVDGAKLSVYEGDAKPQNKAVQTRVWISAKGVPVKSETDIEIGNTPGGDQIHQHLSTRYEYGDIQAPALD